MRDEHIIDMLDDAALARLNEDELAFVRAHTESCADCRRAYRAAQVSALLLSARAAERVEPTPFFQTRVLAALRERQATDDVPALRRMWRAAGALVSSMAATVAVLAALTFVVPSSTTTTAQLADAGNAYSAEDVVFAQTDQTNEQMSDAQVFTTLYDSDDDTGN